MNNIIILRTLQQINTWAVLPGLIYLTYLASIEYYLSLVFAVLLISKVGASIGQHRYFTHRSFKMQPWKEKIVAVLAALSTTGTTLQYVSVHRYHHLNSDRGKDLHSPHEIGYWRSFWHWYKDDPTKVVPLGMIKDLLKNPFLIKLHKYYLLVILSYVLILAAIDINLVLFCYMIPAGFSWWSSAVLSLPLHLPSQGYRNFNTDDETVNSHFWNWLTLGEGLHNNHHAKPGEYNFAFTKQPKEWDISAVIIDKFLK
jgi:stearoyl-CoA desaturase (delta-9 desaturase)